MYQNAKRCLDQQDNAGKFIGNILMERISGDEADPFDVNDFQFRMEDKYLPLRQGIDCMILCLEENGEIVVLVFGMGRYRGIEKVKQAVLPP